MHVAVAFHTTASIFTFLKFELHRGRKKMKGERENGGKKKLALCFCLVDCENRQSQKKIFFNFIDASHSK